MNMEVIKLNVKKFLDEKRYEHVKRVTKCAVEMAKIYGVPVEKVEASAWLHDVAKFFDLSVMIDLTKGKYPEVADKMSQSTAVLHGFAGAEFVRQNYELFGIDDEEILDGIKYHTIGCENMNTLAKIVYLADAIEEKRSWEGVEKARELAKTDLDEAIKFEIEEKLKYLLAKDSIIHPNVIKFRNSIIAKIWEIKKRKKDIEILKIMIKIFIRKKDLAKKIIMLKRKIRKLPKWNLKKNGN